jgi:pimeloyl-ACP methyl ester carboxylesterase
MTRAASGTRALPLAVARDLHARIPGSRLVELPGVGHVANVEAADTFNAKLRAFLRAAGRPAAR